MTRGGVTGLVLTMLIAPHAIASGSDVVRLLDPQGDNQPRYTDAGANGQIPAGPLPDLISLEYSGWLPFDPVTDPYTGVVVDGENADIFRIELVFAGLVNPPHDQTSPGLFRYGPMPLVGFVEFDIDGDEDTGGELGGEALSRPLAVAGRFGGVIEGSLAGRMALSDADLDQSFYTAPQYERSGQDFALVFCNCFATTIVSRGPNTDADEVFEIGETFIMEGRFWQRAQGYRLASSVLGGTRPGLYDPKVEIRFRHIAEANRTVVTFVGALTMQGAAMLTGQPVQLPDFGFDTTIGNGIINHHSVEEAVLDLIDAATLGGLSGPTRDLTIGWQFASVDEVLDPTEWEVSAVFGTGYLSEEDYPFVWSDFGFDLTPGDFNGDGRSDGADRLVLNLFLGSQDGGAGDADGLIDGQVTLAVPGTSFHFLDVDADFSICEDEIPVICSADLSGPIIPGLPDGVVSGADFIEFLNRFQQGDRSVDLASPASPLEPDGLLTGADFFRFLELFAGGCD